MSRIRACSYVCSLFVSHSLSFTRCLARSLAISRYLPHRKNQNDGLADYWQAIPFPLRPILLLHPPQLLLFLLDFPLVSSPLLLHSPPLQLLLLLSLVLSVLPSLLVYDWPVLVLEHGLVLLRPLCWYDVGVVIFQLSCRALQCCQLCCNPVRAWLHTLHNTHWCEHTGKFLDPQEAFDTSCYFTFHLPVESCRDCGSGCSLSWKGTIQGSKPLCHEVFISFEYVHACIHVWCVWL